ncbi:MAG: hypothetical protein AMK75_01630, partial [Planctomycetes bacterium SM23_65]
AAAEEVDLSFPSREDGIEWQDIPGGLGCGVKMPEPPRRGVGKAKFLKPGDPLVVEVYIRNRRGVERKLPSVFYRSAAQGGPAFRKGVSLKMYWSAFYPPVPDPYDRKPPKSGNLVHLHPQTFVPVDPGRTLKSGGSFKAFSFDLREFFRMNAEGSYSFEFEFDKEELGFPPGESGSGIGVIHHVTLGEEPRQLSAEEINATLAPLGGKGVEERLRRSIEETCKLPAPKGPGDKQKIRRLTTWSEPVNGLASRVEWLDRGGYTGLTVFVRLKNVSKQPLTVPTGNPADAASPRLFELHTGTGTAWKRTPWFPEEHVEGQADLVPLTGREAAETGNRRDRPAVTLQPEQETLAYLCGDESEEMDKSERIRVVLRRTEPPAGTEWRGVLETPAAPSWMDVEVLKAAEGRIPFPDFFPEFSRKGFMGGNMSGMESHLVQLEISNEALLYVRLLYEPIGRGKEFELRMTREKDPAMKMIFASLAACDGRKDAALYILDAMKSTDYEASGYVYSALARLIERYGSNPPDWVLGLTEAALTDERCTTGDKTAGGVIHRMFEHASGLAVYLGSVKCKRAVPFLIQRAKKTGGERSYIEALQYMGDRSAVPMLLEFLQERLRNSEDRRNSDAAGRSWDFYSPMEALVSLKAVEAVPLLLPYVKYTEVVEALEKLGDRRAIPALQEVVRTGGVVAGAKEDKPDDVRRRLVAAKLAVATLQEGDVTGRLLALFHEKDFGEFDRRAVVWRLGDRADPKAISALVEAIKTDPSGVVVNQAITVLSAFKYKSAVEGLMDCFDADFAGKQDWKRAYRPEMFRQNIADSLHELTGKRLGADKKAWLDWWQAEGKNSPDLK